MDEGSERGWKWGLTGHTFTDNSNKLELNRKSCEVAVFLGLIFRLHYPFETSPQFKQIPIYYENCVVTKVLFVNFVNEPYLEVRQDVSIFLDSCLVLVICRNSLSKKGSIFFTFLKMWRILCIFLKSPFVQFTKDFFSHHYAKIHQKKKPLVKQIKICHVEFFLHVSTSFKPLNS
jgi:hypothetical protein